MRDPKNVCRQLRPPSWQLILEDCFDHNPSKRPTMKDLAATFSELLEGIIEGLALSSGAPLRLRGDQSHEGYVLFCFGHNCYVVAPCHAC